MKHLEAGTLLHGSSRRYHIDEYISGWQLDATYRAHDEHASNALLIVREIYFVYDGEARAALDRGAERMASLDHPSIPAVLDHFFDNHKYYVVQEHVPGRSIMQEIARYGGRVPEEVVTNWAISICEALQYLHGQDPPIVVNGLRTTNLIADDRGNVSLVDVNLLPSPNLPNRHHTIGRMGYAAPEQFTDRLDSRTDIYSLGAICFHCLTGEDPLDNPLLVFDFTRNPMPRQIEPTITPEMEEMLVRMIAHRPDDRYPSVEELARDLDAHARRLAAHGTTATCSGCDSPIEVGDNYCSECGAPCRGNP